MTLNDLAEELAKSRLGKRLDLGSAEARELIEEISDLIVEGVKKGPVTTPLGTFLIRRLKKRRAYDITNDKIYVQPESKVLRLMVSEAVALRIKRSRGVALDGSQRRLAPKRRVKSKTKGLKV